MNNKKKLLIKVLLIVLAVIVAAGGIVCLIGKPHITDGTLYLSVYKGKSGITAGDLILVNSEHIYNEKNTPKLVSIIDKKNSSYLVRNSDAQLAEITVKQFNKLFKAFKKETGIENACINSAYRSYSDQQSIYNSQIEAYGSAYAESYCALPGYSEHHTGLAADLVLLDGEEIYAIGSISEYKWLVQNAKNYGFIIRYPSDKVAVTGISSEPWHFRYVGVEHAYAMETENLCLEEYTAFIESYSSENPYYSYTNDGTYKIYYCSGSKVTIPLFKSYDISGNNVDGYVVSFKA